MNIHDLITKTAELAAGDLVLEIGSGTGALTLLMADRGASVVAVDLDPAMARLTAEAVAEKPNVRVLNLDVLANKNRLNPTVLDAVCAGIAAAPSGGFKLVANLPYQVATPVIVNLLVHPELCPALMVVTIQRELADRFCAEPASASYGAVSVMVQGLAAVSLVRSLPPAVFWPRPKVDSAVVAIRPDACKRAAVGDVGWFHEIVRQVFMHRRKYLRHVLAGIWRDRWTKGEVDAWLESRGLSGQIRAEALNYQELLALAQGLRERWGELPSAARSAANDAPFGT